MSNDREPLPRRWRTVGALALLIPGILPLAAPGNGPNTADEKHLLDHGWVVEAVQVAEGDRPGIHRLFASGKFLLPAAEVWDAVPGVGDTGAWPGITESVLESSHGDTSIRRYTLDIPFYPDRRYRLRKIHDRARMNLEFSMVPGYGNVREIKGSWTVRALSDSLTGLEYRLDTDPGVKWIPGFIVRWATTRMIPHTFAQVHRVANRSR